MGHLKGGNKVQLTGFGTFGVRERSARTGIKPGTTEKLEIPASKVPTFKTCRASPPIFCLSAILPKD